MQIRHIYIRIIKQLHERPGFGFILYVVVYLYNIYGSCMLHIHARTKPTNIDPSAIIHPTACISPWGVNIGRDVVIGKKTVIKPRTTIQSGVIIHDRCVIGDTGFQIFRYKTKRLPLIHTGDVCISDGVYIGPGTCIDRGFFRKTTYIGPRTKIGANVHIGHNIWIKSDSIIEDYVTVGGNTIIGEKVHIGNNSTISNRIIISSNSVLKPGTITTRDISDSA